MITQHNQRVFYSDNGTLTDITLLVNPFRKGGFDIGGFVPSEDYIIVGSDLPFANKYFDMATPNTDPAAVKVEVWDGESWVFGIDILDDTSDGTASISKNGVISWKTEKDETTWNNEQESDDIPILSSIDPIYCFYWLRISFDSSLSAGTTVNHIGYKFSDDDYLYSQYPDLNNSQMLDCFEPTEASGTKTDWDEQHLVAAQQIIRAMKSSSIVWSPAQILNYEILQLASVHKTAEIIYSALGAPYEDRRVLAQQKFSKAFDLKKFNTDRNKNARLDHGERVISTSYSRR